MFRNILISVVVTLLISFSVGGYFARLIQNDVSLYRHQAQRTLNNA